MTHEIINFPYIIVLLIGIEKQCPLQVSFPVKTQVLLTLTHSNENDNVTGRVTEDFCSKICIGKRWFDLGGTRWFDLVQNRTHPLWSGIVASINQLTWFDRRLLIRSCWPHGCWKGSKAFVCCTLWFAFVFTCFTRTSDYSRAFEPRSNESLSFKYPNWAWAETVLRKFYSTFAWLCISMYNCSDMSGSVQVWLYRPIQSHSRGFWHNKVNRLWHEVIGFGLIILLKEYKIWWDPRIWIMNISN